MPYFVDSSWPGNLEDTVLGPSAEVHDSYPSFQEGFPFGPYDSFVVDLLVGTPLFLVHQDNHEGELYSVAQGNDLISVLEWGFVEHWEHHSRGEAWLDICCLGIQQAAGVH